MQQGKDDAVAGFGDSAPVMVRFMPNWPVRVVIFRVTGTVLLLCSAGMWVVPGSLSDPDLAMFKLGVSIFFFFCGLALLMRNHQDNQPDAYFDPIRHEVRVLQKDDKGEPRTILRRSYDSLGSVDFGAQVVALFDRDGSMLMRLAVEDADVRRALRIQLGGLVRLTERA